MPSFASVDGVILAAHEARVSVFDTGFAFGDAVYETLRTYGGRPFAVERHLRRLRRSAGRIGIELPLGDAELVGRLDALLERAGNPESYIRWVVSRGVGDISYHFERIQGPTVVMVARELETPTAAHYENGVRVALVSVRRNSPLALDPAIKSCNLLNNVLAVREAQGRGAFEALMLNERGELAEGASSNVFVVRRGEVATPPLDSGLLAGITRELVLELGPSLGQPVREKALRVPDLLEADEVFITSTLKEVVPVHAIDDRLVKDGRPGPITRRFAQAFRHFVEAGGR
jgi:branched-chain amino acid aminotransferase